MSGNAACPCGSGRPYGACCEPYHAGGEPPDAVALMRSRYAAFALAMPDYLVRTLHPDHDDHALPAGALRARLLAHARRAKYRGLRILDHDGPDADGTWRVLFHVSMTLDGRDASFVELSSFVHDGEGLRYIAGRTLAPRDVGDLAQLRIRDIAHE